MAVAAVCHAAAGKVPVHFGRVSTVREAPFRRLRAHMRVRHLLFFRVRTFLLSLLWNGEAGLLQRRSLRAPDGVHGPLYLGVGRSVLRWVEDDLLIFCICWNTDPLTGLLSLQNKRGVKLSCFALMRKVK